MLTEDEASQISCVKDIISDWFSHEVIDDYEALETYEELQLQSKTI